jgi:hypothetical protein
MEKTQLILFSAAMAFLAFRLYQKYVVKSKGKANAYHKDTKDPISSALSESDEYEPYSKK